MIDDYSADRTAMWGVPLDEPDDAPAASPNVEPPATLPSPSLDPADDTFLLRGDDPPTDGVYRPRLRGFGDAA